MTRELKLLLDRATERPEPFSPDPNRLIAVGRQRRRNRRIAGSVATLAAVAVVAGGVTVALDLQNPRGVAPASQSQSQADTLCTTSNGLRLDPVEVITWEPVMSVQDDFGTSWIRRSSDDNKWGGVYQYAYCVNHVNGAPNAVLPGRGGSLVRRTPIDGKHSTTTVFGTLHGPAVKASVRTTSDGFTGYAVVQKGFYIYRHVEPQPWPGRAASLVITTEAANGKPRSIRIW
jgi:hypothetical protein